MSGGLRWSRQLFLSLLVHSGSGNQGRVEGGAQLRLEARLPAGWQDCKLLSALTFSCVFETGSHSVVQAGPELSMWSPDAWVGLEAL